MEIIRIIKQNESVINTPQPVKTRKQYTRKDSCQPQWLQDLHRHVKQYKRLCQTNNNKDLKRIEGEVNLLLSQVQ
jgi:hypothetical protein